MVPLRRSPRGGVEVVTRRINRNRPVLVTQRAHLEHETKHVLAAVKRSVIPQIVAAIDELRKIEDDVEPIVERILAALDLSSFDPLADDAETYLVRMVQDGVAEGLKQLDAGAGVDVAQINDAAVAWAKERAAELVGKTRDATGALTDNPNAAWAITDSTREMLRADITAAIEDGTSTADLASTLAENYAFSDTRAEAIARTEIARADVEGNMAAYRESGEVVGKVWLLGSEHTDDDECDEAAAMGVVSLDDDFGGIGDPPAHPNCVCDVAPVVAEDGEE